MYCVCTADYDHFMAIKIMQQKACTCIIMKNESIDSIYSHKLSTHRIQMPL